MSGKSLTFLKRSGLGICGVVTGFFARIIALNTVSGLSGLGDFSPNAIQQAIDAANLLYLVITLGLVGALLSYFYPRIGGVLQITAGIIGCILVTIFWFVPAALFITGGVIAYRSAVSPPDYSQVLR